MKFYLSLIGGAPQVSLRHQFIKLLLISMLGILSLSQAAMLPEGHIWDEEGAPFRSPNWSWVLRNTGLVEGQIQKLKDVKLRLEEAPTILENVHIRFQKDQVKLSYDAFCKSQKSDQDKEALSAELYRDLLKTRTLTLPPHLNDWIEEYKTLLVGLASLRYAYHAKMGGHRRYEVEIEPYPYISPRLLNYDETTSSVSLAEEDKEILAQYAAPLRAAVVQACERVQRNPLMVVANKIFRGLSEEEAQEAKNQKAFSWERTLEVIEGLKGVGLIRE